MAEWSFAINMTNNISFNKLGIFDLEINRVAIDNLLVRA